MFLVRRVERLDSEYLMAIHHPIWNAPDGKTFDVTPFHSEPLHHPILINGAVLFLVDRNANPLDIRGAMAPLPIKFFSSSDDPELKAPRRDLKLAKYQTHPKILAEAAKAPEGSVIDPRGRILS